eukprot:TRINITY_DN393_c0_g1_i1.p1 TRINITY_DN393_c0_g1~~TRINITY_DN393_c0_g1_i1.p1  ORF type:complete len:165 (+),score=27.27 TRINITY_DN393_c0_g1_i1:926-1420(+)
MTAYSPEKGRKGMTRSVSDLNSETIKRYSTIQFSETISNNTDPELDCTDSDVPTNKENPAMGLLASRKKHGSKSDIKRSVTFENLKGFLDDLEGDSDSDGEDQLQFALSPAPRPSQLEPKERPSPSISFTAADLKIPKYHGAAECNRTLVNDFDRDLSACNHEA